MSPWGAFAPQVFLGFGFFPGWAWRPSHRPICFPQIQYWCKERTSQRLSKWCLIMRGLTPLVGFEVWSLQRVMWSTTHSLANMFSISENQWFSSQSVAYSWQTEIIGLSTWDLHVLWVFTRKRRDPVLEVFIKNTQNSLDLKVMMNCNISTSATFYILNMPWRASNSN